MLIFPLLAAVAAQPAQPPKLEVAAQARAVVRIVRGERISASELPADAIVRETRVRGADGADRAYRLVEFP
jgi:hypothetical protein